MNFDWYHFVTWSHWPLPQKLYIFNSLKGTATLMIIMFYQKELYEPWILIQVSSKSVEKWASYGHLKNSIWLTFSGHFEYLISFQNFFNCLIFSYEGCSNMNASGFITFFTYMLRQNGKRFYKGLYVTFKVAPDQKKNTVYLSGYSPLNEGHVCILTNSMLRTYTSDRDERIILWRTGEISWKLRKCDMLL